jgi:hypothetical protein
MDDPLARLRAWLTDAGFREVQPGRVRGGDHFVRFVSDQLGVRLVSAKGAWSVDVSSPAWGGDWYDVALVRAALDHLPVSDAVPLDQQVTWVTTNMVGESLAKNEPDPERFRGQLEDLVQVRAQGLFLS